MKRNEFINEVCIITQLLQSILPTVQKPARYTGGEYNEIKKDKENVPVHR